MANMLRDRRGGCMPYWLARWLPSTKLIYVRPG